MNAFKQKFLDMSPRDQLLLVVLAVFGLATRDTGLGDNPDRVDPSETGAGAEGDGRAPAT